MIKLKKLLLIIVFLSIFLINFGLSITSTVNWLRWGSSARLFGTGESGTALIDDVSSTYWNPAGLAHIENPQMSFIYVETPLGEAGYNYSYFSYAHPITIFGQKCIMGESIYYMGIDTHLTPNTVEECEELIRQTGNPQIGVIKYVDTCGTFGFGWQIKEKLLAGISYKLIYSDTWATYDEKIVKNFNIDRRKNVHRNQAFSWAFDLGVVYKITDEIKFPFVNYSIKNMRFAPVLKNIGPDLERKSSTTPGKVTADPLPHQLIFGIGCDLYDQGVHRITFTADPYFLVGKSFKVVNSTYVEWKSKYETENGKVVYNKYNNVLWNEKNQTKGKITYEQFNELQERRQEKHWPYDRWQKRENAGYQDGNNVEIINDNNVNNPKSGEEGDIQIKNWEKSNNKKISKFPEICIATTESTRDALFNVNFGLEYCYGDILSLRIGRMARLIESSLVDPSFKNTFTAGIGVKLKKYVLDYAYLPWGSGEQKTHIFSIKILFEG
ncbi:MAG: PorV/PorQ family protein [bacterium]